MKEQSCTERLKHLQPTKLDRRDLLKMGFGAGGAVVTGGLVAPWASAQQNAPSVKPAPPSNQAEAWREQEQYDGVKMQSGPGWKNDAQRASGNGPMDDTSRKLVKYISSFSESYLSPSLIDAFHDTMVDSIASIISGFETDAARVCAHLARKTRGDLVSTVLGYGIQTTPELAAYANSTMGRTMDFNDHSSDMMGGILALGEALHATGTQVMVAIVMTYQIQEALRGAGGKEDGVDLGMYYGPAAAAGAGKLLGLNEDQLANAMSLALTLHVPLRVDRSGTLSMQKGCATADAVRSGTFCALAAKEGMTGPARPFEGRDGLWAVLTGPYKDLRLPPAPKEKHYAGLTNGIKRRPAEGNTQAMHEFLLPQIRAWTKAEDIETIHIETTFVAWREIADPPKWDPRNHETADHSLPYEVARALLDGDVYLDSFTEEKFMDPEARRLMDKITVSVNPNYTASGQMRMTVRNKAGAELVRESNYANPDNAHGSTPIRQEEIGAKFKRVCAFKKVSDAQRDRALEQWSNLRAIRDIADAIRNLAKFGEPKPL